jgi:deoxyribose-phosphate aldolase
MTRDPVTAARQAIACLDLTDLNDTSTAAAVADLCARARTPHGPVAAICIWPRFVAGARPLLAGTGIRIATVVSFPDGDHPSGDVLAMTRQALADGADEIDLVVPYRALMAGQAGAVTARVREVRSACGGALLKTILETGELKDPGLIRAAAREALAGGADFLKTSTGKVAVNATPDAARILLEEILASGRPVGLKPAGGVRTTADAATYLDLADAVMGDGWARPASFRIGASGVLADLLATLDGSAPAKPAAGY